MDRIKTILQLPLIELAHGTLTVGSLLLGFATFCATLVAAHLLDRTTQRVVRNRGAAPGAPFAAGRITRYVTMLAGTLVAVSATGVDMSAAMAASAVLLVGIGVGLQSIVQSLVAGVVLLIEQPVRRGDFVKIGDILGVVGHIGLRATTVLTRDDVTVIIPNADFVGSHVVNHSQPSSRIRIHVKVGVAYGSDTARVSDVLRTVAAGNPRVLAEPAPEVRLDAFGDSSLDFTLLAWILEPKDDGLIASELRLAIDAAFRRAGITIPFPQRDVHLHPAGPAPATERAARAALDAA